MKKHIQSNLLLLGLTLIIGAVIYPLAVLAVGQGLFPSKANGSMAFDADGRIVGSQLIAQEFKGNEWFWPRPSAVGYTANASGGSNLGANNPKLRERVEESLKTRSEKAAVPADAVTASGSGLDPHITLSNAEGQVERIVAARASKTGSLPDQIRSTVKAILQEAAFKPLAGIAGGEPLVNVLELNLELARRLR